MPQIGPYRLRNNVLLAPMAGVTDVPFRELVWRLGAGSVVSEMTTGRDDLWHSVKSAERRQRPRGVDPFAVQIAGSEPEQVAHSAARQVAAGAEIIDINFGCPAKKVCRKAAGSALLEDPDLVEAIARAAVAAVDVPVTVKMRTGPSPERRNAVDVALRLQDAGVAALAVHGRTRACRFLGEAEFDTIAAVKEAVTIPVFANGDIDGPEPMRRVLAHTGADGVMIGRAALGAPWLPGVLAGVCDAPGPAEQLAIAGAHVAAIHDFYGSRRGPGIACKHAKAYLAGLQVPRPLIQAFLEQRDPAGQQNFIAALEARVAAQGPAALLRAA